MANDKRNCRQKPKFLPYQLRSKKRKEEFIKRPIEDEEVPKPDPKKLKQMKKKLNELNRKIKHSKKKNDGMIHKRNALRKAIDELKRSTRSERPKPTIEFTECERAFGGAYRSYRVNGVLRMDVDSLLIMLETN